MSMHRYTFYVAISGVGRDEDEAWDDAVNCFCADAGSPPLPTEVDDCEDYE